MSGTYRSDPAATEFSFVVGRNIRRLRQARKLNLTQLAGLAGLKPRTLETAEDGRTQSFFVIARLAAALGVSVAEFTTPLEAKDSAPKAARKPVRPQVNWNAGNIVALSQHRTAGRHYAKNAAREIGCTPAAARDAARRYLLGSDHP